MAQIPTYNDSITAQGGINAQANPNAFGAQVGAAITKAAEVAHDYAETDEVTRAHRLAAAKQLEWERSLTDRSNSAKPGDDTFAESVINDVQKDLKTAGDQFKTRRAQQLFSSLSDSLTTSVGTKAIHFQKNLDGEFVQVEFKGTVDDESKLVNGNEQNYEAAVERTNNMVDDPNTRYKRVDAVTRLKLKNLAKKTYAMSAVEGQMARDIYGVAAKLMPDLVTQAYSGAASASVPDVADIVAQPGEAGADPTKFGKRSDGSKKGQGFLGVLKRPDGGVSTEISIGVNIDGKELEIPTLVPTLTRKEVNQLLSLKDNEKMPEAIVDKAVAFAKKRMAEGKSVFAGGNEAPVTPVSAFVNSVFGSLVKQESNGVHSKDGKLTESSAGALGITQVMPATGTDPGYGVAPLKNQSKEEYIRFGKDYLAAMYKEFGGDADKALAAYNAGPGAVKDAVAAAGPNWLSKLPIETQGYVAKLSPTATTDAQGKPMPQLKVPKDASLAPPQTSAVIAWNDLDLDTQQKYMGKVVADFNSRVAADRATLTDDRANMHANFDAGNEYANEKQDQARYAQAYGAEIAKRMIAEDANLKALGQFKKGIRGQSMAEIAAAMGPAPGSNSSASDYETYKRKEAAVKADREELKQDPVSYVSRYSTPVRQAAIIAKAARDEAQSNPSPAAEQNAQSATQKLIASSLAEQRRLGIANPEILSKDEEKQLTAEIERIQGSGQNVAQGIDALYKSYGSYGPTVAAQMAPKVGGLMNVLGSEIDPNAAALLVEANRNKEALKKTISEDKLKDLDVAVQAVMSNYSASLVGVPNGSNVQANYQEQIMTLAMARMSKLGESQGDAVQKAYKALVADQYTFQDGYRVPVKLDAKAVRIQADSIRSNIRASDVALLSSSSVGNPDDRMAAQLAAYRSEGRWVTTSQTGADGKLQEGLTLMIPTAGGYFPVPAADGKPLFRSFGQMLTDYQVRGVQTSQDALARGDMRKYFELHVKEIGDQRRAEDQRLADTARAYRAKKKGLIE
jgi:hypothetical protein